MAGEEKFEFVQPTGREHVFVCCGARYGRFMYAQLFGDVAQDHRAHRFGSIIKVSSLLFNYGLRNAQKSFIAGFQTDRKSTRLHSSHQCASRMPSSSRKRPRNTSTTETYDT